MINTAVILAAGLGSRLGNHTTLKPKGFMHVDDFTLIDRSINLLINSGIERILIGTGYLSEVYEEYAQQYPQIQCVKSDLYETTSSMYTLYNIRDNISDDFLLLESDLLYEQRALNEILEDNHDDIVLGSGKTTSGDEVYIQTDNNSNLVNMSKDASELVTIDTELVGISKVSIKRYLMMCNLFEAEPNKKIDYEYIMVQSSRLEPFYVKNVTDLVWCEIDDDNHLQRALTQILPKIRGTSQ